MQTSLTSLRSFLLLSPQLLMMRIHEELYSHLKLYPRRVIIPHRLNPYPEEVQYVITAHHIAALPVVCYPISDFERLSVSTTLRNSLIPCDGSTGISIHRSSRKLLNEAFSYCLSELYISLRYDPLFLWERYLSMCSTSYRLLP